MDLNIKIRSLQAVLLTVIYFSTELMTSPGFGMFFQKKQSPAVNLASPSMRTHWRILIEFDRRAEVSEMLGSSIFPENEKLDKGKQLYC